MQYTLSICSFIWPPDWRMTARVFIIIIDGSHKTPPTAACIDLKLLAHCTINNKYVGRGVFFNNYVIKFFWK